MTTVRQGPVKISEKKKIYEYKYEWNPTIVLREFESFFCKTCFRAKTTGHKRMYLDNISAYAFLGERS